MRAIEKYLFLSGLVTGLVAMIFYTYIQLQNWKILECVNSAPGVCAESQYRKVMANVLFLICPAQIIQILTIGVNAGVASYLMWIFTVILNDLIFYTAGRAFRAIFRLN